MSLEAGVLEKQGRNWMLRKRWQQRYFVLTKNMLTYSLVDKTTKPLKSYPRERIVQILYNDRAANHLEFIILFDYKTLALRARNLLQRNAWIQSLKPDRKYSDVHPVVGPVDSLSLRSYIEKFARPSKLPFAKLLQRIHTARQRMALQLFVSGVDFRKTLIAISELKPASIRASLEPATPIQLSLEPATPRIRSSVEPFATPIRASLEPAATFNRAKLEPSAQISEASPVAVELVIMSGRSSLEPETVRVIANAVS